MNTAVQFIFKLYEYWLARNIVTTLALVLGGYVGTEKGWSVLRDPASSVASKIVYTIFGVLYIVTSLAIVLRFWLVRPVQTQAPIEPLKPAELKALSEVNNPVWRNAVRRDAWRAHSGRL